MNISMSALTAFSGVSTQKLSKKELAATLVNLARQANSPKSNNRNEAQKKLWDLVEIHHKDGEDRYVALQRLTVGLGDEPKSKKRGRGLRAISLLTSAHHNGQQETRRAAQALEEAKRLEAERYKRYYRSYVSY